MTLPSAAVFVFMVLPLLLSAQQDPPHSYSWYSGDIAGEIDRMKELDVTISEVCVILFILVLSLSNIV